MVIIITMKVVNINEFKAKLSEYLDAVAKGEIVIICNRNQPVAELRAVAKKRTEPRPIGGAKGTVTIPPSFYEPMPDEWLDEFYNGPIFPTRATPMQAKERAPTSGSRRRKKLRK
jgi:prevent-host-death family protein